MEKLDYKGWPNCYRLTNGIIDLEITSDVGPRIIRFGFVGEENEFEEVAEQSGKTGGYEWRIYGGHRLWHAPEEKPRTYYPDNFPVTVEQKSGFTRIIQPVESTTGIQKTIDIAIAPDKAQVKVTHRLTNSNLWAIELAPWSLSVMEEGGTAILPLPERGSHDANLRPTHTMSFWAYTDMADPRWTWGREFILLRQDPYAAGAQKLGLKCPDGWVAYARNDHLFVKQVAFMTGANYPDQGCSIETYTCDFMLEVETLGPMVTLTPGATVEHIETWNLFKDVPVPTSDKDVKTHILPKVKSLKK